MITPKDPSKKGQINIELDDTGSRRYLFKPSDY